MIFFEFQVILNEIYNLPLKVEIQKQNNLQTSIVDAYANDVNV